MKKLLDWLVPPDALDLRGWPWIDYAPWCLSSGTAGAYFVGLMMAKGCPRWYPNAELLSS